MLERTWQSEVTDHAGGGAAAVVGAVIPDMTLGMVLGLAFSAYSRQLEVLGKGDIGEEVLEVWEANCNQLR